MLITISQCYRSVDLIAAFLLMFDYADGFPRHRALGNLGAGVGMLPPCRELSICLTVNAAAKPHLPPTSDCAAALIIGAESPVIVERWPSRPMTGGALFNAWRRCRRRLRVEFRHQTTVGSLGRHPARRVYRVHLAAGFGDCLANSTSAQEARTFRDTNIQRCGAARVPHGGDIYCRGGAQPRS